LMEALWTSIEMSAFIPLSFTLPIAVLYLAYENPEQAADVYHQIQSSPLISRAQFFKDIFEQYLPDEVTAPYQKKNVPQTDVKTTLWSAASNILSNWMQLWMEEPEYINRIKES